MARAPKSKLATGAALVVGVWLALDPATADAAELRERPGTAHFVSSVGRRAFKDPRLAGCEVVTDDFIGDSPVMFSGRFAAVFKLHDSAQGKNLAMRCFRRDSQFAAGHSDLVVPRYPTIAEEFAAIAKNSKRARLPLLKVELIPEGVAIGNEWHPVVLSEWHEGQRIDNHVRQLVKSKNTGGLEQLGAAWLEATEFLERRKVGHCDLQHGNVRVDADGQGIVFIDYDAVWLEALKDLPVVEESPHYQHPGRGMFYGRQVDYFPSAVIYLSLKALAEDPGRWERRRDRETLLLTERDLNDTAQSAMFKELKNAKNDEVRTLAGLLTELTQARIEEIPPLGVLLRDGWKKSVPKEDPAESAPQRKPEKAAAQPEQPGTQEDSAQKKPPAPAEQPVAEEAAVNPTPSTVAAEDVPFMMPPPPRDAVSTLK